MVPRIVEVTNIVEMMQPALVKHDSHCDRVHGSITPSFVEEPTTLIKPIKVVHVLFRSPPSQITNFKVTPHMTQVPTRFEQFLGFVCHEVQTVVLSEIVGVFGNELFGLIPQSGDCIVVFVKRHCEAVSFVVHLHEYEWIIVKIAVELDTRFDTPVVIEVKGEFVAEEEAGLVSTHVTVTFGGTVDDVFHLFTSFGSFFLTDPFGVAPVFFRDQAKATLAACHLANTALELFGEGLVVEDYARGR